MLKEFPSMNAAALFPKVLHPCDLEFTQLQETPEAELKVTLTMSDISLHVSATTLHIFFDVMDIMSGDRKVSDISHG